MRSIVVGAFTAAAILLSPTGAFAAMSENFQCGTGPADICSCIGKIDCRRMRTSGMCDGPLTCDGTSCSCSIVNFVRNKPRAPSGSVSGMRPIIGAGKSLQSPPTLKLKPILPVNPVRMK